MTQDCFSRAGQASDQLGTLALLRCLDCGENTIPLHLYNLRIDCCLLKFYEKLIIDSILNMLFELIYIRLENVLGFLIYFSSVPTVRHSVLKMFYSMVCHSGIQGAARIKCSGQSRLVHVAAASGASLG